MKTNDITFASFPKAGVSYLGYLLATARAYHNNLDIRPNFFNIDWLLVDQAQWGTTPRADIWHDGMGDFIKTHDANPGGRRNVIYMLRHPFDTLRSYYHFTNKQGSTLTPQQFLDSEKYGINTWLRHLTSWVVGQSAGQPVYVVQYENVLKDPEAELWDLFDAMGFQYSEEDIDAAVAHASLDNMRRLERTYLASNPSYQRFNLEFVRPGDEREVSGFEAFRGYVEQRTNQAYKAIVAKLP